MLNSYILSEWLNVIFVKIILFYKLQYNKIYHCRSYFNYKLYIIWLRVLLVKYVEFNHHIYVIYLYNTR